MTDQQPRPPMTKRRLVRFGIGAAIVTVMCATMMLVWPPDIFSDRVLLVEKLQLASGETVIVWQYCHGVFGEYWTCASVYYGDGRPIRTFVLDGDAAKWWTCTVAVQGAEIKISHGTLSLTYSVATETGISDWGDGPRPGIGIDLEEPYLSQVLQIAKSATEI